MTAHPDEGRLGTVLNRASGEISAENQSGILIAKMRQVAKALNAFRETTVSTTTSDIRKVSQSVNRLRKFCLSLESDPPPLGMAPHLLDGCPLVEHAMATGVPAQSGATAVWAHVGGTAGPRPSRPCRTLATLPPPGR